MSDELTEDQVNQIRRKLQTGHKLAAVKLYKDLTGSSLLTAKNNVEQIEAGEGPTPGEVDSGLSSDVMDEILDALQQGRTFRQPCCGDVSGSYRRDRPARRDL